MAKEPRKLCVAILPTEVQSRNHYIAVSIAKAFARHPAVSNAILLEYVDAVDTCRNGPVDVLIALGGAGAIAAPLLRAIENARKSVLWTTEDPYEFTANQDLAAHFDHVFTNDDGAASRYKSPGASFLPLGASRDIHQLRSPASTEKLYDVFFVGTAWPNRIALLNKILAKLGTNLRLKFGLSGNNFLPNCSLASLDMVTDFRVAPQEFTALAARSRVVLTLDRDFSASESSPARGSSPPPRIFELAMSGTPQVYLSNGARLNDLYAPGKEIIVAPTVENAVAAIRSFLSDPASAERMGQAALNTTMSCHLYDHRAATILTKISSSDAKGRRTNTPIKKRKRVLSVSHNVAGVVPFGGVELYQETVSKALLAKYDFFELYPARHKSALVLKDHTGSTEYETQEVNPNLLFDHRREEIFQDVLLENQIDLVHFHHFLEGHSFAYPMIARALGIPTVITAHDYFMVCSQFTLINHLGRYCHVSDPSTRLCDICLSVRGLAPPGTPARRREIMRSALENVDYILHNSEYTRGKFRQIYPWLEDCKHLVVGMASSPEVIRFLEAGRKRGEEEASIRAPQEGAKRLQVSILGNFTRHKGGQALLEMFFQLNDIDVDFYIDGFVDHEFRPVLNSDHFKNVTVRGQYTQHELRQRLYGIDVSIHFSLWPETYCIAIDEARAAGLVPIVLGFGALAERVQDGLNGFCLSPDRPYDLVTLIARLAAEPKILDKMKVEHGAISASTEMHLAKLEKVYDELVRRKPILHESMRGSVHRRLYFSDLGMRVNHPRWDTKDILYDDNATFRLGEIVAEEQRFNVLSPNQVIADFSSAAELDFEAYNKGLIGLDEIVNSISEFASIPIQKGCPSLLLRAWLPSQIGGAIANVLLLGAAVTYSVSIQDRRDVVVEGAPSLLMIGRFDPSKLPQGVYRVAFALLRDGKTEVLKSDLFLSVGECDEEPKPTEERLAFSRAPNVKQEKHPVGAWFERIKGRAGRGVGSIDTFGKFFSASGENVLYRNQYRSVNVRGWILPKDKKEPLQDIKLELASDDWTAEFEAKIVSRPDVADYFNDAGLVMCGFTSSIPVEKLPAGTFRVSVNGKLPKGVTVTVPGGTLTIV